MQYLSAAAVARMLGVKTQTLAKWRRQGRGPEGAVHLSATLVVYPSDDVDRFVERRASLPSRVTTFGREPGPPTPAGPQDERT